MNTTSILKRHNLVRFLAAALLCVFALAQIPLWAPTDTPRLVKYAQNDIGPVKAKLRF